MKKKNYKLYYATEENGYKGEKIVESPNIDTIKDVLENNIADDVDYEGLTHKKFLEYRDSLTKEGMSSGFVVFQNANGYDVIYIVTTNGRDARKQIADYRREFMQNF